jgi:hypothetical protein
VPPPPTNNSCSLIAHILFLPSPILHTILSLLSSLFYPEDEGSKFLWNIGTYLPNYEGRSVSEVNVSAYLMVP